MSPARASGSDTNAGGWTLEATQAAALRQCIRDRRRSKPLKLLAVVSEKYLRAYYNEGFYEFDHNGEAFALETFADWRVESALSAWDVGANNGGWATTAHRVLPQASIESFEILPPVADAYAKRLGSHSWATLHRMGLSDRTGEAEVTWNRESDSTSSISIRKRGVPGGNYKSVTCRISTIDEQVARGLPKPALLKIDTEGHDAAVLRGATDLLASDAAPAMIQFEYGETWLPASETLERTQSLLEDCGYSVGRLYPNHVAFKSYAYSDDHFRMGNMIAANNTNLIERLSRS